MSYDIQLVDAVTRKALVLESPHHMKGGTYAIGGTVLAHLNVTYNYCKQFCQVLNPESGIRSIYGLSGAQSIPILDKAISMLSDEADENYWKPTEGNVKRALLQLRALATMRPDGVWDGD